MHSLTWIATTKTSQWQSKGAATTSLASEGKWDVEAQLEKPLQTIDGFGACFNELGWTALSALDDKDQNFRLDVSILRGRRAIQQFLAWVERAGYQHLETAFVEIHETNKSL